MITHEAVGRHLATFVAGFAALGIAGGASAQSDALGTSVAALFNASVLLLLLRRRLNGLNGGRLFFSFVRIATASAAMGMAAVAASALLTSRLPGSSVLLQIVRLGAAIAAALVTLSAAAWLLRIQEFKAGVAIVTRRFRPRVS